MTPTVPWTIEKLEPRWSPARLVAGPLPSEFGANLVPPEEFDAEDMPEPEIVLPVQIVDSSAPVVVEFDPNVPDLEDAEYWEELGGVVKLSAGTLVLNNSPFQPVNQPPRIEIAQVYLVAAPVIGVEGGSLGLTSIDSFTSSYPSLNSLAISGGSLAFNTSALTQMSGGTLRLTAPGSSSVQLGGEIVTTGVVTAVAIGDLSAVLHDALRFQGTAPSLALSAEGSTLPVEEEVPPVVPPAPVEDTE